MAYIYELEVRMWEAAKHRDPEAFLEVVSPDAVMVCGGQRCTGAEYARIIPEFDCSSFVLEQFEIVNQDVDSVQVHYVVRTQVSDPANQELAGTFRVTTTWRNIEGNWKAVFNMDHRIG